MKEAAGRARPRAHGPQPGHARASALKELWAPALRRRSLVIGGSLMDGVSRALRRLPQPHRYRVADLITLPLGLLWTRWRPQIKENFATLLATSVDDPRVEALARRSVRNYGRMAIDFLTVRTMSDADVLAWVEPVGEPYFEEALRPGRGVIFALAHVGSWDVAATYTWAYGLKLTVVTESNWATELVAGSRADRGVTLVGRDVSLRVLFRALARNECVAMISDIARADLQTAAVPFCGRPARFPLGPARLAQHTGAPVLVCSCVRLPDNRYRIAAQPPLWADSNLPPADAAVALTAAMVAGFERIIRAYPDQWYPFHRIWTP